MLLERLRSRENATKRAHHMVRPVYSYSRFESLGQRHQATILPLTLSAILNSMAEFVFFAFGL